MKRKSHGEAGPTKRSPWWTIVLLSMFGLGLVQEQAKIKINHYLAVATDSNLWEKEASHRKEWWDSNAPEGRHNFYVSRDTWGWFHRLSQSEMVAFKWGFSAMVLLGFLVLDMLLLKAWGVPERVQWLFAMYVTTGFPMVGFALSSPGDAWYALARECLGFLQSPLPSLLVIFIPVVLSRLNFESTTNKSSAPKARTSKHENDGCKNDSDQGA